MRIKINSLIKLYIVLLLSEGPKHGYELIKNLELKLERDISASQIYPFLKLLRRNKFIQLKGKGKREKKTYYLSKKGRDFANSMLTRFGDLIDIAIEPKLTVCTHCSCKIYEGGHKEKIKGKMLNFCCHHCAKAYKPI